MAWKKGRPPRSILPTGKLVHYGEGCMLGLVAAAITGREPEPIAVLLLDASCPFDFKLALHSKKATPDQWHWPEPEVARAQLDEIILGRHLKCRPDESGVACEPKVQAQEE